MNELWLTVRECVGLPGMPGSEANIRRHLQSFVSGRDGMARKRGGSKAVEYSVAAFPLELRAAILAERRQAETANGIVDIVECQTTDPARDRLWQCWERADERQRETAKARVEAVIVMCDLIASGVTVRTAAASAARSLSLSENTLRRWYCRTQKAARADWAPVLLDSRIVNDTAHAPKTQFDDDAWDFIRADYLRPEQPALTKCYERLELAAREHCWAIPSFDTVRRRIEREVPQEVRVFQREGENALARLFPAQQRTVAGLHALEWINGDGYHHNVFVKWYNGEILRPKTWFWQDVYSRKIIGWRCDVSENSDSIRLSLMDVIKAYGRPEHVTIDNTRAAANKWLSGGVPNRYRFKVKPDDPMGILPLLGIQLHWTSVIGGKGWGQAKPVERAFGVGGMEEYVDKHPSLSGAYTGPNPLNKPDNYGTRVVDIEDFLTALEEGVAMFNAKPARRTEICKGEQSFDQAFEQSYSRSIITRLSDEQIRQLMLPAEAVTVKLNGEFTLQCGGTLYGRKNSYWNPALANIRARKITVRFDPRNLHDEVACYDLEGRFICTAECRAAVAFGDTETGREHSRQRKQMMKATKKAARAQKRMTTIELNDLLPKITPPAAPARHVVERVYTAGNTARKIVEQSDEQRHANDVIFQKLMKNAKRK
ncbi:TPA: Mu transposase C-terminal domain-containing protein [Escherichia coli]|nr:Mu transposase C-terminal domain-containing protein [Escherichia coli]